MNTTEQTPRVDVPKLREIERLHLGDDGLFMPFVKRDMAALIAEIRRLQSELTAALGKDNGWVRVPRELLQAYADEYYRGSPCITLRHEYRKQLFAYLTASQTDTQQEEG